MNTCFTLFTLISCLLPEKSHGNIQLSNIPLVSVTQSEWGDVTPEEIRIVLQSTANLLFKETGPKKWPPIVVSNSSAGPIVFFNKGSSSQNIVHLKTTGRYWCQYVFQFAHELGHIICGFQASNQKHLWFEETICEISSLIALRKMTLEWEIAPPSPQLYAYAPEFSKYAQKRLAIPKFQHDFTVYKWFIEKRLELEATPIDYKRNLKIAKKLLPLFEESSGIWEACTYLHLIKKRNQLTFEEYLQKWVDKCPNSQTKEAVKNIAEPFGLFLEI